MPATDDDTLLPFSLPSICQKKVTAAFDGGRISSDGGVLLWQVPTDNSLIDTLAAIIPDHRDPGPDHTFDGGHPACPGLRHRLRLPGYDDLDDLRKDPAFKLTCGRLPESGDDFGLPNRPCHVGRTPRTYAP